MNIQIKDKFKERTLKLPNKSGSLNAQLKMDYPYNIFTIVIDGKEFKVTVDDIVEGVIDHVESKLFENINKNDTTSIIFFLKTRGKKRGYVERQEIDFENPITGIKFIDA